jgi:glycosyltransferase involved in cell wall biosynthesis
LSSPARILYVTPFDEPISGADESLLLAIRNLDRSNFEPHVLLPPNSNYLERYRQAGAKVHPWPLSRMRRNYNPLFWFRYVRSLWNDVRHLPQLLGREGIALVHLNMHVAIGVMIAANRAGVPVVMHYRAKTNDQPQLFFDVFLPWLYKRAGAILCISRAVANHFLRRGLSEKVSVLYNPVDFDRFLRGDSTTPHLLDKIRGKKIVLFIGRIHPQKRIHILLDALEILAKKHSDLVGVIVGSPASDSADQKYFKELQEKSSRSSVPLEWVSHTPNVHPYLSAADVLALPSVHEGFGRVLVEAMACGVPVVGANSGAIPEVLGEGKWGQIAEADRPQLWADAIHWALSEPRWKEVARKAKAHALDDFSVATHVNRLKGVYEQLIR